MTKTNVQLTPSNSQRHDTPNNKTHIIKFRMLGEMIRLLGDSTAKINGHEKHISSFQAFTISLASRVGTGNLAGVATALTVGGPGAIF